MNTAKHRRPTQRDAAFASRYPKRMAMAFLVVGLLYFLIPAVLAALVVPLVNRPPQEQISLAEQRRIAEAHCLIGCFTTPDPSLIGDSR